MPTFYSIGFFGAPNFGDELLCKTLVDHLVNTIDDADVRVMTRSSEVSSSYTGLETMLIEGWAPTPEYTRHLVQHLRAVWRSDLILIGGGGLISDHYTWHSAVRYFTDVCWAVLLQRRYAFVGLGVVGIKRWWLRPLVRFACRHAASIYVRDATSSTRMHELSGRTDIQIGPDLASLASLESPPEPTTPFALVNFREKPPINEAGLRDLIETLADRVGRVVLLPAQAADLRYYRHIVSGLPAHTQNLVHIEGMTSLGDAITHIAQAQVVVAERLHVNVVAAQKQKRLLVLEYEHKVTAYMESVGTGHLTCSLQDIGAEHALGLLSLDPPNRTSRLLSLQSEAGAALKAAVATGLSAKKHAAMTRVGATCHLGWLIPLIGTYGVLILIKRLLFGRGAIGKHAS